MKLIDKIKSFSEELKERGLHVTKITGRCTKRNKWGQKLRVRFYLGDGDYKIRYFEWL